VAPFSLWDEEHTDEPATLAADDGGRGWDLGSDRRGPRGSPDARGKNERPFTPTADEKTLVDLTNKERQKNDLPPLKPNAKLFEAARAHSANMAKQKELKHELDGKDFATRVKEAGYAYGRVGENIAMGPKDFPTVMRLWMESPAHKANILNKDYTEVGIGIARDSEGVPYYTQVFAAPLEP
jgi:uncharacterized protein YkwD